MPQTDQFQETSQTERGSRSEARSDKVIDGIKHRCSVTALVQPDIAFAFWRNFKNFPLFMKNIGDVEVLSPKISHWTVRLKNAPDIEWDAEIIAERKDEMIAWKSIGDAIVKQAGSVWFRQGPNPGETVITLNLIYSVPGGKLTQLASKLIGDDPKILILQDLRRFKAYIESGEVPTTEGQPHGREEQQDTYTH